MHRDENTVMKGKGKVAIYYKKNETTVALHGRLSIKNAQNRKKGERGREQREREDMTFSHSSENRNVIIQNRKFAKQASRS
jgi:hypothetical protein